MASDEPVSASNICTPGAVSDSNWTSTPWRSMSSSRCVSRSSNSGKKRGWVPVGALSIAVSNGRSRLVPPARATSRRALAISGKVHASSVAILRSLLFVRWESPCAECAWPNLPRATSIPSMDRLARTVLRRMMYRFSQRAPSEHKVGGRNPTMRLGRAQGHRAPIDAAPAAMHQRRARAWAPSYPPFRRCLRNRITPTAPHGRTDRRRGAQRVAHSS
ncbi:hypothetical protein LuPra_02561 [Luteitalea pratensis]|uniref:Uncharacterized protein n=1 Tax=Luteitalea pratensis TaxID=1855912 RepID=A0A143PLP7_LUTPR|nr:hypothetical protein LuPra_02561 [Luteitalea pratensis]